MIYKDYLNAARKHEHTCEVLCKKLKSGSCDKRLEKSLLLNMYYLSGYIIECIVKYAIYDLIAYKKNQDIRLLDQKGLTYNKHIKHHRFDLYTEHLTRYMSCPIPLISTTKNIEKEVLELYKHWDTNIRYRDDLENKRPAHYFKFYEYGKTILNTIRNNVRG